MNAVAKWQEEIDGTLNAIDFSQVVYVPLLFYKLGKSKKLEVLSVKVVDDVLLAGKCRYYAKHN